MSSLRKDYVVALDFGYPNNPQQQSSITDLAAFIMRNYADEARTVVLAQDFIYDSLCRMRFPRERLLEVGSGQSSTAGLESGGSYHMLQMASALIRQLESENAGTRPLPDDLAASGAGRHQPGIPATVVAHALHVRRVVRQGTLVGLRLTPAKGLPTALYRNAAQWWCRNRWAWHLREAIGFIPLKMAGQI